mmetsp:Transcript_2976/g.3286  ORF Transcript_2976/g.3286 Transcript_2976/m.3286 type:complete len:783 (+) Transcript_2976:57-2405(+)
MSTSLGIVKTQRFSVLEIGAAGKAKVVAAPVKAKKGKKDSTKNVKAQSGAGGSEIQCEWTTDKQDDLSRILSIGEECIAPEELKALITAKGRGSGHEQGFNLYDGFEPSGRMHIAQGVFKAMNVNKCTSEGTNSTFIFWVADWFALMNDKMGGDLVKIKIVGEYLIEVWKAAGMNLDHVVFKWASDEITNKADVYWPTMLDVARSFNITRIKKCCQIMGRLEGNLSSAQVLYPLMQCTDVFFLKADICQLGVDQRKVNMLAREYCVAAGIKRKPVILSHHMLYGLMAGQEKMSKSNSDSAIFMEDSAVDVERKILAAYCPSKEEKVETGQNSLDASQEIDAGKESMQLTKDTLKNPCLDYIQNIIFSPPDATFTANGITYTKFEKVKEDFLCGVISEDQLKKGLILELNELLEPVRNHFNTNERAKELLAKVQQFKEEGNTTSNADKKVRRLNLVATGKVKPDCHAVFAPLPSAKPRLQEAFDTLTQLKSAQENKCPLVLFLPDWTARVCNKCNADIKAIDAFYTVLIAAMKALNSELMHNVDVIKQSDAILSDPSNYWISVINVGRHFMLNDIMGINVKDADGVGVVIGRLMKIADVMGLDPSSVSFNSTDDASIEKGLISRFYEEVLTKMSKPELRTDAVASFLLQERESEAHRTEHDEYYVLDDPKVHGKSKMKKAFCEPGNIKFCPPIVLSMALGPPEVVIKRSAENGGDVTCRSQLEMETIFENGALHPGDLKATACAIMVEVLEKVSKSMKEDKVATKAAKTFKAFEKKMSKKKKK